MIICFTPNPAIDTTYSIADLEVGETHKVQEVHARAGGKAFNSASVLTTMGQDCLAMSPIGSSDQRQFEDDLDQRGIRHCLAPVPGGIRRSVAAIESDGRATVFNEPGYAWPVEPVREGLLRVAAQRCVLVVAGSIPHGCEEAVLEVIHHGQAAGLKLVLDLRGSVLANALPRQPDLVKPNRSEAADTLGLDPDDPPPAMELADRLLRAGARAAVVSDGNRGLALAVGEDVRLHARLSHTLQGNPTGAGDALTAALARHLANDTVSWAAALRDGVAWSAAAVLQPVAGQVDPADVVRLRDDVVIE